MAIWRSWVKWTISTACIVAYVAVARVESEVPKATLELTPGNEIELRIWRAFDEPLNAGLSFNVQCTSRPNTRPSRKERPGYWEFTPDHVVQFELSTQNQRSVIYEALPADRNCGPIFRRLTANLAVAPGLYRQPPPANTPGVMLNSFRTTLRIKVTHVDPPLVGSAVEVAVLAPLSFKHYRDGLGLFWFALFLEPVFWVTQIVWLLYLVASMRWAVWEKRRRR